jgi:hypothetical protein
MKINPSCLAEESTVDAGRDDDDLALAARLERMILCRTGGRISNLRVECTLQGVLISGRASTYYAKQLASHAALCEVPAAALENCIEVE